MSYKIRPRLTMCARSPYVRKSENSSYKNAEIISTCLTLTYMAPYFQLIKLIFSILPSMMYPEFPAIA